MFDMSVFNMHASSFWEMYAVSSYFNAFHAYFLSIYSISLLFIDFDPFELPTQWGFLSRKN